MQFSLTCGTKNQTQEDVYLNERINWIYVAMTLCFPTTNYSEQPISCIHKNTHGPGARQSLSGNKPLVRPKLHSKTRNSRSWPKLTGISCCLQYIFFGTCYICTPNFENNFLELKKLNKMHHCASLTTRNHWTLTFLMTFSFKTHQRIAQ